MDNCVLVCGKIESLDRGAGFISTFRQGQAAADGKGDTAEVSKMPEFCFLGRQRISAGLSQLCGALSKQCRNMHGYAMPCMLYCYYCRIA